MEAKPGLRERKKARTRAGIQREALRLFAAQGYEATTVEQVAAAAEVAASTVFRYFPTKEDLVLTDDYDPEFFADFAAQPPGLSPLAALRATTRTLLGAMPPGELDRARERTRLVLSVPALRGAGFENWMGVMRTLAGLVAERTGRDPADPAVGTFTGAILGVMIDVAGRWAADPALDLVTALDEALARLEDGLPL